MSELQSPFVRQLGAESKLEQDRSLRKAIELGNIAMKKVIIIGIPGAGKTSLAGELKKINPGLNYVSLGEISRKLDPSSRERLELDRLFQIGSPIGPSRLFLDIMEPTIDEILERGEGFMLDGMPKKTEEVDPLFEFLEAKDAMPDMILSCEVDPRVAHSRVLGRDMRAGDPDDVDVFLNRTKTYLRDYDDFRDKLAGEGTRPIITLRTESISALRGAEALDRLMTSGGDFKDGIDESDAPALLHEALTNGDDDALLGVYGKLFDDNLPELDHSAIMKLGTRAERRDFIELALSTKNPIYLGTPMFLRRLSENYIDTTLMSIEHLKDSLKEEIGLRHDRAFDVDDVKEIFEQQIGLKRFIRDLQAQLVDSVDLTTLIGKEIATNMDELKHIEVVLAELAQNRGIDPAGFSMNLIMNLQARYWGQLTSNQTLASTDFNYRRRSNGLPDSHHSLLPYTDNPRSLTANSMGNYIPFIEAVSASGETFNSTFGFIHFIGQDKDGKAYGVEYPIMMHDRRLLDLKSDIVNRALNDIDSFYGNHDMWHNLLPVFSKSFILHHPDAPLSYGGRLDSYMNFGNELREEKEEYEIGVAMAHARTQQERFTTDEVLKERESLIILNTLDSLHGLDEELKEKCSQAEIDDIKDYLACKAVSNAFKVFPHDADIFSKIEQRLKSLGISGMDISSDEVYELLDRQGLINLDLLGLAVQHKPFTDQITSSEILSACIDRESGRKESGAEHIIEALEEWGVIEGLSSFSSVSLSPLHKARWLSMVAPQRQQLKGHMEKVHGKAGYMHGGKLLNDPRELILLQSESLRPDLEDYEYRLYAREENQRLSYDIYSLLFDDDQDVMRLARSEFNRLRSNPDVGKKLFARDAVVALDELLDALVRNTYEVKEDTISYLLSYAESLDAEGSSYPYSKDAIDRIIRRYQNLSVRENEYQQSKGIRYADASQSLQDDHMEIA